jgi:hypothetical protein
VVSEGCGKGILENIHESIQDNYWKPEKKMNLVLFQNIGSSR